jgi:hypothetical protein
MTNSPASRRLIPVASFTLLLATLGIAPAFVQTGSSSNDAPLEAAKPPATAAADATTTEILPVAGDGSFVPVVQTKINGKPTKMQLTGTAVRKAIGLKFYRIAGYCDVGHDPDDVDELASADVPKQLILVLERDIPENVLRRSFQMAFDANDPEKKYTADITKLLDHVMAEPLKKGDQITLTHLPQVGVECRVGDDEPLRVAVPLFAHVVWNVYMGPNGVCPVLRAGLGKHLTPDAVQ